MDRARARRASRACALLTRRADPGARMRAMARSSTTSRARSAASSGRGSGRSARRGGRIASLLRAQVKLLAVLAACAFAFFLAVQPAWYVRARSPVEYPNYIRTHAGNYGLDPYLIAAVIEQESGFDHEARSSAGAVGLMQLTPETASGIALRTGGRAFDKRDLLDPELNIRYGSWYLDHLRAQSRRWYRDAGAKPSSEEVLVATLASYNGGQGNVHGWIRSKAGDDDVLQVDEIPFDETRSYVDDVLQQRDDYRRAYPDL